MPNDNLITLLASTPYQDGKARCSGARARPMRLQQHLVLDSVVCPARVITNCSIPREIHHPTSHKIVLNDHRSCRKHTKARCPWGERAGAHVMRLQQRPPQRIEMRLALRAHHKQVRNGRALLHQVPQRLPRTTRTSAPSPAQSMSFSYWDDFEAAAGSQRSPVSRARIGALRLVSHRDRPQTGAHV